MDYHKLIFVYIKVYAIKVIWKDKAEVALVKNDISIYRVEWVFGISAITTPTPQFVQNTTSLEQIDRSADGKVETILSFLLNKVCPHLLL